jgi:hypothetical protein
MTVFGPSFRQSSPQLDPVENILHPEALFIRGISAQLYDHVSRTPERDHDRSTSNHLFTLARDARPMVLEVFSCLWLLMREVLYSTHRSLQQCSLANDSS